MKRRTVLQIRRYGRSFAVLLALMVVGTSAGFYILLQQRLPDPFESFYSVNATFASGTAVVPGLGEPVNVAGVHVGEITGASLKSGQAVIHMQIDPSKIKRIYRDATVTLFPNTPLKDMEIDIAPGHPSAGVLRSGGTIPASQTAIPIDSDDLLDSLDTDTRTWFTSLITMLSEGVSGRGQDLRSVLRALGPTSGELHQITGLLAARRQELAQIVHNLGVVSHATSEKDGQLRTAVDAGNTTIQALATQNVALREAITRLPGTLSTARTTLTNLIPFSNALGPTATALLPQARRLPTTLRDANTLFSAAALLPLKEIPPFVSAVLPLARQLPPLSSDLGKSVPALIDSFKVTAYVVNELAYDPGGKNPGFLYWLAWFAHNANSFISNSDANGPVWRALILSSCSTLQDNGFGSLIKTVLGTDFGCPA